jgi:hypothetical protein
MEGGHAARVGAHSDVVVAEMEVLVGAGAGAASVDGVGVGKGGGVAEVQAEWDVLSWIRLVKSSPW